jgi:hypothetical protein
MVGRRTLTRETVDGSKHEVIDDQSIETPATTEFGREMDDEAFMNELVEVEMQTTTDENAPSHIILSVNGTTQPLLRGVPTTIKRKYVEVLARCKESKYSQRTSNPNEPDRIEMIGRTALAYPYQILRDSPKGLAWHRAVLAEAA